MANTPSNWSQLSHDQIMPTVHVDAYGQERIVLSPEQYNIFCRLGPLLSSNFALSPEEELLVQGWRNSLDAPINNADANLSRLRSEIDFWERHKSRLHDMRVHFDRSCSAFHRFPVELLQEIFENYVYSFALDDYSFKVENRSITDVFAVHEGPWLLGQVCRTWRAVSQAYYPLWSNTLFIDASGRQLRKDTMSLLKSFMQHIDTDRDISFRLVTRIDDRQSPEHELLNEHVWQTLISRFSCWRNVHITCDPRHLSSLDSPSPTSAARLRELSLCADLPDDFTLDAFSVAPQLRHVELDGLLLSSLTLPYAQIRSIKDHTYSDMHESPYIALDILRACPQLQSRSADSGHSNELHEHPPWTPRFVHTSLTSLETTDIGLLQALSLPNLISLHVHPCGDHKSPVELLPWVLEFIRESQCDLQELKVEDCRLEHLLDVLWLTPNLTSLLLAFMFAIDVDTNVCALVELLAMTTQDARRIAYRDDSMSDWEMDDDTGETLLSQAATTYLLLPKLRSFTFYDGFEGGKKVISAVNETFVRMLDSRYREDSATGLKEVQIEYVVGKDVAPGDVLVQMSERCAFELKRLRRRGLDLYIVQTYYHPETRFYII